MQSQIPSKAWTGGRIQKSSGGRASGRTSRTGQKEMRKYPGVDEPRL